MNNRLIPFPILGVLTLALVGFPASVRAAEGSTNAPTETAPVESAPAETPAGSPIGAVVTPSTPSSPRPTQYTVANGDTLWYLSHKFGTSIRQLKKLNHLTKDHLKPGQVLKIPAAKGEKTAPAKKTTTVAAPHKARLIAFHASPYAQQVQDFDLPASTFASCPVPVAPDEETVKPSVTIMSDTVPVAVSKPSLEPTYLTPSGPIALDSALPLIASHSPKKSRSSASAGGKVASSSPQISLPPPTLTLSNPAPAPAPAKPVDRGFFNFFYTTPPSVDWGARFTQVARDLGDRGIDYDEDWRPPGESHSWTMDCSNTTRYLYRATTGIQLPRTASDQYYYLHLQKKAWDVPMTSTGFADCNYLRQNLRAGDLLFWENTYKPDRQPPITHVMIFLGTNPRGQWIMAGSQTTRGGEHNRRHGGPDIYVFNPTRACGGYSTWMGLVHHQGRFCAFGRPLEADKSKLAVATDD